MSVIHITGGHIVLGASSGGGGTDTSDATATAADILNAKTAYGSAGTKLTGTFQTYRPALMQFDGSTGYYEITTNTTAGNKGTTILRFNRATFANGASERLCSFRGPNARFRMDIALAASNNGDANRQSKLVVTIQDSGGTDITRLLSSSTVLDGEDHIVFTAFDGDAGTAILRIDGADEDDTGNASRIAPQTATLDAGASSSAYLGALNNSPSQPFSGTLGFVGHIEDYLTSYEDFMNGDIPLLIDESGWSQFGGNQPEFFNPFGNMADNRGSAGNMTKNGTVTLVAE